MNTIKFDKKNTLVIAHRGLSGLEKENTNAAFVAAGNRSYYGIETDIHKTKDGHFVINHDDNFKRVAGEEIIIEQATLEEIQNLVLYDVDNQKSRIDLRPTTLQNYLSICKKYEKHSILELKSNFTDEDIAKIIDIIKSYDYLENVTFIAFNYENLLKVRKILPNQSCQYLFWKLTDEEISRLVKDKIDADVWCIELTEEQIKKAHKAGLKVNCWTVNEKENGEKFASWGIDFITSNILE
jgi:glycerophosphoryl diester phosphodiesterase